jgi:hypothetical protein
MDGKETHTIDSLSRLTKVEELRRKIQELFHVEPGLQRLFYRGKQVSPWSGCPPAPVFHLCSCLVQAPRLGSHQHILLPPLRPVRFMSPGRRSLTETSNA